MPPLMPPSRGVDRVALNLKEHCLICLRHQEKSWIDSVLLINTINDFQPLVCYLLGAPHDNLNSVNVAGKDRPESESTLQVPKLKNCPPLCANCYHLLSELNRLHLQFTELQKRIQKHVGVIRNVVKKSSQLDLEAMNQMRESESDSDSQSDSDSESDKASNKQETLFDTFIKNIQSSGMQEAQITLVSDFVRDLHQRIIKNELTTVQFPTFRPSTPVPPAKRNSVPKPELQEQQEQSKAKTLIVNEVMKPSSKRSPIPPLSRNSTPNPPKRLKTNRGNVKLKLSSTTRSARVPVAASAQQASSNFILVSQTLSESERVAEEDFTSESDPLALTTSEGQTCATSVIASDPDIQIEIEEAVSVYPIPKSEPVSDTED